MELHGAGAVLRPGWHPGGARTRESGFEYNTAQGDDVYSLGPYIIGCLIYKLANLIGFDFNAYKQSFGPNPEFLRKVYSYEGVMWYVQRSGFALLNSKPLASELSNPIERYSARECTHCHVGI